MMTNARRNARLRSRNQRKPGGRRGTDGAAGEGPLSEGTAGFDEGGGASPGTETGGKSTARDHFIGDQKRRDQPLGPHLK